MTTAVSSSPRTAVVAATRPLVRAGLEAVVATDGVAVVASAETCELLDVVAHHRPDVVVVALTEQDDDPCAEIARVVGADPDCRVLALTEATSVIELREAVAAGVRSLVLADTEVDELRDAVTATLSGARVLDPLVSTRLADAWTTDPAPGPGQLTARELEVLQQLAEGLTNARIAAVLGVSARTVKTHVQHLLVKLDSSDRTGAVAEGFRRGLLS